MSHAHLLKHIPLFEGLTQEDRAALTEHLREREYKAGAFVFSLGDLGSSMYVVLSGEVQISLPPEETGGERVVLREARAGDYFGEFALFDDRPRSATVQATVDTTLLELTREEFADHISGSRTAAMAVLGDMARRLRETNAMFSQRAAANALKEIERNLTWSQRLADKVAQLNGSWTFILFLMALTAVWTIVNLPGIAVHLGLATRGEDGRLQGFDPYPFILFNLVLAILVALQGPLIVMSQNRQSLKDRAQAESDFRVNLKNELGIETLRRELGTFQAETLKRLDSLEDAVSETSAKAPESSDAA